MLLEEFDKLLGHDRYVLCNGKVRKGREFYTLKQAQDWLAKGGTIGWWVSSGHVVVDIDEGQQQAIEALDLLGIKTLMCKTTKGLHVYFKGSDDFPQKTGMTLPIGLKCDTRCANKGYVLLPYGTPDREFNNVTDVIPMPREVTPFTGNDRPSLFNLRDGAGRNPMLYGHISAYRTKGASDDQAFFMAEVINQVVFKDALSHSELVGLLKSNTKKPALRQERQQHSGDNPYLLYTMKGVPNGVNCHAIREYFVNRGDIFVIGGDCYQYRDGIFREAGSFVRNTIGEMIGIDKFIKPTHINDAYKLILDDMRIRRNAEDLNGNRYLINFKNGVYDIKAKQLIDHSPNYLQTIQIPYAFTDTHVSWEETRLYKFLSGVCELDEDNINMIAQYFAYCLTTDYGLKTFMVLQGQSNTGKSVLIRYLETLVGKRNRSALSMQELSMRFYPSKLYDCLLNSCADNSSLPLQSIENLKKITGGDFIMHENKGKEPFFFVSFAKLIFSFNQLPLQLEEKSNALYLRMRVLHMNKQVKLNNEYVDDLCSTEGMLEVIPHLLARLPVTNIPRTAASNTIIEDMRQDSDSIHAFLAEFYEDAAESVITKRSVYDAYAKFCVETGREAHRKHAFIRHMKGRGYKEVRNSTTGEASWRGLQEVTK